MCRASPGERLIDIRTVARTTATGEPRRDPATAPSASRDVVVAALAFLLVLAAYQWRLDAPALWGDEADTGNFARSVLANGVPSALLGHNVLAYQDCFQLSGNLLSKRLPWLQYYVGAASIRLFGDDTAGLRRLFAAIGALSFLPLWLVLRRRLPGAPLVAAGLLLAPQAVLFGRRARYYPIALALFCLWLWRSAPRRGKGCTGPPPWQSFLARSPSLPRATR